MDDQTINRPGMLTLAAAAVMPILAVSIGMHLFHNGWAALLLYHAGILAFLVRDFQLRSILRTAKRGFKPLPFVALTLACMLSGILVYVLWPWLYFRFTPFNALLAHYGLGPVSRVLFILYFSLLHPIIEESYWRGWFAQRGAALSPAIQDVAFAAFHVSVLVVFITPQWTLVAFTVLTLIARTWRTISLRYGGLAMPILSHAVADFTIVGAGFLLAR